MCAMHDEVEIEYSHLASWSCLLLTIRTITRVMMVARDTTSITAMATEIPTVRSLLAGVPEPKKPNKYH